MGSIETYGGVLMNHGSIGVGFGGTCGRARRTGGGGCDWWIRIGPSVVPSLAIHLDREANKQAINASSQNLVFGRADQIEPRRPDGNLGLEPGDEVLAYDLCAYPIQPSELVGLNGDFVLAPVG